MPHFHPYHTIDRPATPVWSALDIASYHTTRARTSALVTWLRCPQCHGGYFLAGAPSPQPCPALAQTWPTCGRPFPQPFDVRLSGLLDLALQALVAVSILTAALQEEALP